MIDEKLAKLEAAMIAASAPAVVYSKTPLSEDAVRDWGERNDVKLHDHIVKLFVWLSKFDGHGAQKKNQAFGWPILHFGPTPLDHSEYILHFSNDIGAFDESYAQIMDDEDFGGFLFETTRGMDCLWYLDHGGQPELIFLCVENLIDFLQLCYDHRLYERPSTNRYARHVMQYGPAREFARKNNPGAEFWDEPAHVWTLPDDP